MKLTEIVSNLNVLWSKNIEAVKLVDVEYDSRCVKPGFLFFCIKGPQDDGHLFIDEALDKGAAAVVVSKDYYDKATLLEEHIYRKSFTRIMKESLPIIVVGDTVESVSKISALLYNYPSRSLNVIGITGTNGKTSTTFLIESILNSSGLSAGITGTILYRYASRVIRDIEYTTPKSLYLQRIMNNMVQEKVSHLVMEVSSHGIELGRVSDIDFDVVIFTNLTRDHMEFHTDMEDYFGAKKKLFIDFLTKSSKKQKTAIINIDCKYGRRLIEFVKLLADVKLYTYGFSTDADVWVEGYELHDDGSNFKLRIGEKSYDFNLPLVGKHNIYNALSAITLATKLYNIDYNSLYSALSNESVIPGRLERVTKGCNVFVDYAHTDDALNNVLLTLRNVFPEKRIITLFGCGGDRDKGKRPKMGKVVSDLSDYAVVTSDNPRFEDPLRIIDSIIAGMCPDSYEVVADRRMAIKRVIEFMDPSADVVLIAGKGHETYQDVSGVYFDFDDRAVAMSFL